MMKRTVKFLLKSSAPLALAFAALALLVVYMGGSSDDPPSMAISGAGSEPASYSSPAAPTPRAVSEKEQARADLKPGAVVRKRRATAGDPSPTAEPLTTSDHEITPPTTRANTPSGAKDPRIVRSTSWRSKRLAKR